MVRKYTGNRDIRFVRVQRGGLLDDPTHQALALWAADCAERVLMVFTDQRPEDVRPAQALAAARAWAEGEITMLQAREFAYAAHGAAREATGAAREAARAAGHAVATAHMADHELGAAYYALRAVRSAFPENPELLDAERDWQRGALTAQIRELVLSDMEQRSTKFQGIFSSQ